jgi:surfactin family lipopeptide synthetase A
MTKTLYQYITKYLSSTKIKSLFGDSDEEWSSELTNIRVDSFAYQIDKHRKNDGPQLSVAILLPRNNSYLSAIFGCWKSGNYYIPLNIDWPLQYSKKIIGHLKPDILITDIKDINFHGTIITSRDVEREIKISECARARWASLAKKEGLAYIIYTSGSTGEPKGVMISKKAFVQYVDWVEKEFREIEDVKNLIVNGEITFDISLADFAFAIAYDTQIFISQSTQNIISLVGALVKYRIESIYAVPTTLMYICRIINSRGDKSLSHVRTIFSGGDVLTPRLIADLRRCFPNAVIFNMYGPTETTINCMSIRVDESIEKFVQMGCVPTGRIPPHICWKLRGNDTIGEHLEEGELLISGNQVMDGYLSEPDLTEASKISFDGCIYYRTGDYFKRRGDIFFYQGREDNLVKVHGYRINTSDITAAVTSHHSIFEAVTLVVKVGDSNELVVFYSVDEAELVPTALVDELRAICLERLPKYMQPRYIFRIEVMPKGGTGKYDTRYLHKFASEQLG